ncbi:T9SS type A sorting domain-containing protein [Mesonia aestuariivivens]|uniref:T9SS type A sorting domain-containing protein n=1 Tax=Mesonia aestuariivivens TaxID=2796128 RepID=A0ABS6W3W4_9FLAO|nr:T9SS type A sorting domain-containing protein [Mesonia aestuariivivens]MBW2962558.1 T9SS type A sorting domain-containing protein [Mesonia aestuariivivens]
MKKITLALFAFLCFIGSKAQYTTPNTGVSWTLTDLLNTTNSPLIFDGTNYTLTDDLIIAENDSFQLSSAESLYIDENVLIQVFGYFSSHPATGEMVITATDSLTPYEGFRFEDNSEININNTVIKNGGGLRVLTDNFTLTNSYLAYNVTGATTGAVVSVSYGSPIIKNNTFIENDLPAVASGANQEVSAIITGNYLEGNGQSNQNRPQINMGPSGIDTLKIIQNTIIGDPELDQVGGIAVANLTGSEIRCIIDDNTITNNRYGITIVGGNSFAYLRNNIIEDNNTQGIPNLGGSGISLNSSSNTQEIIATNNEVRGNLWGITVIGEASINLGDNDENPGGNVFANNENGGVTYALYNNTPNTITALHNCWIEGQENTLADAESVIFHQPDDSSLGEVLYDPVDCEAMDINKIELEKITFYPNPALNKLFIENTQQLEGITILDLTGKQLQNFKLREEENQIDISLKSGMYLIQFKKGNAIKIEKLIVE